MQIQSKITKLTDIAFSLLNCVHHNQPEHATLPSVDCSKAVTDKQADSLVHWHMRRWFKNVTRDDVLMALFEITHAMMEMKQRNSNQYHRITKLDEANAELREAISKKNDEIRHMYDQSVNFEEQLNRERTDRRVAEQHSDSLKQQLAVANHRLNTLLDRFLKATENNTL